MKESCFPTNLTTGGWTFLDDNSNSSVPGMGVYRRILYPVDVLWLEPPAFQEELVKSPTFHSFVGPILHNVVKGIFAWFYLVSTEQIRNRMSLQIIKIGYNSSEMDRDRYSGNCLFKIEAGNGEEEEEQKKNCVEGGGGGGGGGVPHTAPSMRYSERR